MATIAVVSKLPVMHIIRAMTGNAAGGQLDFSSNFLNVTGQAVNAFMRTIQLVLCLDTVVELPQGPVIRVMTRLAMRPHAALVYIIGLVAGIAVTGCSLVHRSQMTLFARRDCMQAKQRETAHVVFKAYLSGPALLVMAIFAVLPLLAPVDIIRAMTTEAPGCKLLLVNLTFMTR